MFARLGSFFKASTLLEIVSTLFRIISQQAVTFSKRDSQKTSMNVSLCQQALTQIPQIDTTIGMILVTYNG